MGVGGGGGGGSGGVQSRFNIQPRKKTGNHSDKGT